MGLWEVETWVWILPLVVPPIVVIAVLSFVVATRQRLLERLQRRWGWLGPATVHQGQGRAWTGEVDGRSVVVRWFEDNTTIEVDARPTAEVGFTRTGQPPTLAGAEEDLTPIEVHGKLAWADDPATVQALARAPGVDEALGTLLGQGDRSLRAVRVDPRGTVSWFARYLPDREVTAERTREWVRALLVVARASEA